MTSNTAHAGAVGAPAAAHRRPHTPTAETMAEALRRYPAIGEEERAALVRFLREGPSEGIARAIHMNGLDAQLAAFKKTHPGDFPTGLRAFAPLLLLTAAAALLLAGAQLMAG